MRGGGRLIRLIVRIIFVRFIFHTFGFVGGIIFLICVAAGVWFLVSRRRGGRSRWG